MPSRLLREGILDSERINALDWPEEVFYRRLMSKVDDYGLFDARPAILRSTLYPLKVDRVREADITRWIAACEKAGVIALYYHGGKPYGQMLETRWQTRSEPKHPLPPWGKSEHPRATENNCKQSQTVVPVFVVEDVDEDEDVPRASAPPPSAKKSRDRKTLLPDDFGISERVTAWAAEKGFGQLREHLEAFRRKATAKGYAYVDWDSAFMEAIREDWAKLRGRTKDGVAPPAEVRSHDSAEDTQRMLKERDKGTGGMPAEVRQFAQRLTGRKAA